MSSWASRLSTAAKAAATSPTTETCVATDDTSAAPAQPHSTPKAAELREEFRQVAEAYNDASAVILRLPPDCWDTVTQYLGYVDVVALGHACRSLWVVLHTHETVWWRQLAYFHRDVRDLRGGKLLCTAPLFPKPPADAEMSQSASLVPSPTLAPPPPPLANGTTGGGGDGALRPFAVRASRRDNWVPMSAHERFFQERRVYVLDSHREWHFRELADVEDKATGMFTAALHNGKAEPVASPLSAEAASLSFSLTPPPPLLPRTPVSSMHTPVLAAVDSARDTPPAVPPSPISLLPQQPMPTPQRRTGSQQASAGNSPALAPSPGPPTPPLLPRVGDPIINDHNPLLQLRIYTVDSHQQQQHGHTKSSSQEEGEEAEEGGAVVHGASNVPEPPMNFAGMTEEQVMAYVLQVSLQEAQQQQRQRAPPPTTSTVSASATTHTDLACWPHSHYRGGPGASSLPLGKLLIILDSINNNADDQLDHHHVRDCTSDEDPHFLQRLAETLRSAKHRRLHLGNHHRAVRNNGQTTRNRAGRSSVGVGDGSSSAGGGLSVSLTGAAGAAAPPPPPPMNRMLRGFHGSLLEITEKEARAVATRLLGKPNIIDDFVVFRCYDPAELYRRLCPPCTESAPSTASWAVSSPETGEGKQAVKHGMLVSVPAPLYADPTAGSGEATLLPTAEEADVVPADAAAPGMAFSASSVQTVMRAPPLKPLPFFTRFFLAPELCHDGFIALIIVDVVRALVVVDKEVVGNDSADWESPLIDRSGRVVVPGQGYNPQAYTRRDYDYVPPVPPRRRPDAT